MEGNPQISILIDTDIGSDIDDAVALAYLARQPQCDLLGVTVVSGDVQQRAALAEIVLRAAGREDVPIHCGRRAPLLNGPGQPKVPQYDRVKHLKHSLNRPENTAIDFLRKTIRNRCHEVTLVTIGQFSNIALLFAMDPEIPFLLKNTISMGGRYFSDGYEWNMRSDSTASAMLYHEHRRNHTTLGLDITVQCQMDSKQVKSKFVGEPLETVFIMAEAWFEERDVLTFHDPLVAALVFKPELCKTLRGKVSVDETNGRTRFIEGVGHDYQDHVGIEVDVQGFFDHFFEITSPSEVKMEEEDDYGGVFTNE
ncbi:Inosine/uridine-preferring nucleoside hydrolase [Patellaria atrata CBS 101060]|uniref:Inosine/uridine-preferring nucleoside hydrolase n=1 Tax=Patellaria atrata CBS 101060 TaxID=1346257 RepID=A0A9P4S4E9_9PEZI|nr:Inosine/uridine-preferring nucleoside hydrolase [Patellaria atrata CBS 101060]